MLSHDIKSAYDRRTQDQQEEIGLGSGPFCSCKDFTKDIFLVCLWLRYQCLAYLTDMLSLAQDDSLWNQQTFQASLF